jgi:thiol-disulfide isomerase/thioredoxin
MKNISPHLAAVIAVMALSLFPGCKRGAEEAKPAASQPALVPSPGPAASDTSPAGSQAVDTPSTAKIPNMDYSIPLKPISDPSLDFQAYRGKRILIFYFGPTCPHCQAVTPTVKAYAAEIRAKGVETVAIANGRAEVQEIKEYISQYKVNLPVFWDPDRKFGVPYNVTLLPTFYAVGKDGEVYGMNEYSGRASLDSLLARI